MVESVESIDAGAGSGPQFFQIAEPFSRADFLLRYQQVALFAKLMFAPFGLHYQTAELLNEKAYLDTYTQTFQQLEDVMSKCIFRHFGYSDDRIIATMHKFIGQQNDMGIMKEIKPATDSLIGMALPAQVVDYSFDKVNFNELFSAQTCQQVLQKIVTAISSLHQHVDTQMEIDTKVQRVLGISIAKRIASPVLEFHELSSKQGGGKAADIIQQLTESLTICVHKQIRRHLDDTSEEEVVVLPETTNISLNYDQYIALIEQFGHGLRLHSSANNDSNNTDERDEQEVDISQLQNGSVFRDVNKFMHPTISFILQLCEKLKALEGEAEGEQSFPVEMAEKSLHFTLAALVKMETAKASSNAGDAAAAMEELSVDLLDSLEVEGTGEVVADVVVPVFLHTQLLIERSKYHAEIGNLNGALADTMMAIALDSKCAQAYAMRSQLLLASLQSYEPLEAIDLQDIAEETSAYLQQLFPSDVVEGEGVDEQDLVMHQAAEDALLAFLLGGSSDIASAAAAEEAARETCRKFAKATYTARHKAKQAELNEGSHQGAFPRPWLVSAYFSGYELLSTALQVFGDCSVDAAESAAENKAETETMDEIDEGDYAEKRRSLAMPPDHLLDEGKDAKKVLREQDVKAYDLLLQLVEELEQCNAEPDVEAVVGLDVKDKEVIPDEIIMYRSVPVEAADDLLQPLENQAASLPRLRDSNAWRLVTCGREEAVPLEVEKRLKVVDMQLPKVEDVLQSGPDFTHSMEGLLTHCLAEELQHCMHLANAMTLLTQHADLLGVQMNTDGSIQSFKDAVPDFAYSLLPSASSHGHGSNAKFAFSRRNAEQEEDDEDNYQQKFNPEDFFKAHFGEGFGQFGGDTIYEEDEDEDDEDEWEDADDSDEDEEDGKGAEKKKNKKVASATEEDEDEEDVWEDCDDDEEEEEDDDDDVDEDEGNGGKGEKKKDVEVAAPTIDVSDLPLVQDEEEVESHVVVSNADELDVEQHRGHVEDQSVPVVVETAVAPEPAVFEEVVSLGDVIRDLQDLDVAEESEAVETEHYEALPVVDAVDEDEMERRLLSQFDTTVLPADHEAEDELDCEVHDVQVEPSTPPTVSKKLRARLLNVLGSLVYLCGDTTGALKCFEASLHFDPSLVDSKVKLGSLLIDMDEHDKAQQLLRQCVSEHAENPVVYLHYAELAINQNDFPQAVQQLRKANRYAAMGWTPDSPKICTKDFRASTEWLAVFEQRKAMSMQNIRSNIFALLGVATFRENPNKPEYAMSALEEGLELYPNAVILLLCTGEVHSQCGDMVKSIKMFRRASLLEAGHPLPWVNAARTYQQLGQLDAASAHVKVALSLDPSIAMTRVDHAQLLRQADRMDEAVETIDVALTLARQVSEIRDVMTARYVTLLQQSLKQKGLYTSPISI